MAKKSSTAKKLTTAKKPSTRILTGVLLAMAVAAPAVITTAKSKAFVVPADEPNVHNMLIVGRKSVFLSHLPMFSSVDSKSPHRFQVILEASFTREGADAQAAYFEDRIKSAAIKIYTLNPDQFVLSDLTATKPLSSFLAKVFRGHLEKEGQEILSGVNVQLKNVVHFREFDPKAIRPAKLEYILFGKGDELFLAHFITRPPDFDQVISVSATGHGFSDEDLAK